VRPVPWEQIWLFYGQICSLICEASKMTARKELPPQGIQVLEESQEELLQQLNELVVNDPEAPYVVARRMSLILQVRQWMSFGGHFPKEVARYAIAVIASTVVICSDSSEGNSLRVTLIFLGSALVAQVVDVVKEAVVSPRDNSK
jgi:hypothetical protein